MNEHENKCLRKHETGFSHFNINLDGIEHGFDFGKKLIVDPKEGDESYTSEPYLSLYVSVYHPDYQPKIKSLEYSLFRSKWKNSTICTEEDNRELIDLALPKIKSDVQTIINGDEPEAFDKPKFL